MQITSRHVSSKTKPAKWKNVPCKEDSFMMQPLAPMEMDYGMKDMTMDMMKPMMMDMNMDMMQNQLGSHSCTMPGYMMSPQMVQKPVPQCMQELYLAYPYLNPNR